MKNKHKHQEIGFSPAGPVSQRFMESEAFVRGLMGPIGSGKSVSCVMEILKRAACQKRSPDGKRRSRFAIIRNTYPELKSTTIKTWSQWCPLDYGRVNFDSPITHRIENDELDLEVIFLALDRPEDIRKLLSLELTGAWVNEAREIKFDVIKTLLGRVARFPPVNQGGCSWSGIIMDTNPPDNEHWWYRCAEVENPEDWEFFRQPSGLSDTAENRKNLHPKYYERLMHGTDPDWQKVYVHGEYGFLMEGKAVYPMFRDSTHVSEEVLEPDPNYALMIGADFGMTPAAVIGQRFADGSWYILDEFVAEDMGIRKFAENLTGYIQSNYPNYDVSVACGDPSGDYRSPNSDDTCLDLMNAYTPWKWYAAQTNELAMRLEVVKNTLNRLVNGRPAFLMSNKCVTLRKGFNGKYQYKLIKGADAGSSQRVHEKPDKNEYSHPHDALQYLMLGGGESDVVLNKSKQGDAFKKKYGEKLGAQMERAKARNGRENYSPLRSRDWKPKGW